jgi:predicted nucleic acid-binding protein
VILADTGPLVALFDPQDDQYGHCREVLTSIREPLFTTVPVLTEAFHMLAPGSQGSDRLRDFIMQGGLTLWFMNSGSLQRAFELMEQYADHPMDLADASLIVAAETLGTLRVFTIDLRDFATYRIRRGHRHYGVEIIANY